MQKNTIGLAKILTDDEQYQSTKKKLTRRLDHVKGQLEGLRAKKQSMERALDFMQGLRRGITVQMASPWSLPTQLHWLFVKRLEIKLVGKNLRLGQLDCLVIPEVVQPQTRHQLPPGQRTSAFVKHTSDELVQEIISSLTDVEIGTWSEVLSIPCDVCGADAAVVCHRGVYQGDVVDQITAGVLCLECPQYTQLVTHPFHEDVPFLTKKED